MRQRPERCAHGVHQLPFRPSLCNRTEHHITGTPCAHSRCHLQRQVGLANPGGTHQAQQPLSRGDALHDPLLLDPTTNKTPPLLQVGRMCAVAPLCPERGLLDLRQHAQVKVPPSPCTNPIAFISPTEGLLHGLLDLSDLRVRLRHVLSEEPPAVRP